MVRQESCNLLRDEQPYRYSGGYDLDGLKHGEGKITWDSGDKFEGTFSRDIRDGIGILRLADGCTYNGGWKSDQFHGSGTWRVPDGYCYTGQYENGQCNGRGFCKFPNHDQYIGEWKDGLMHGQGVYSHATKEVYEGMHCRGKRHGPGRLTKKYGMIDVLQHQEGTKIGEGVRWSKNKGKAWFLKNGKKKQRILLKKAKSITTGILGCEV
mmetsp:Transcript_22340/g.32890  ORF Transcript_22340/g.32890 Transcript_22340/m.32890 type:complete len:210 (-) Transcript_22340:281-910(-)